jgi:hypothetical protein
MALGDVMGGEHRPQLVEAVVAYVVWGMGEVVQRRRATPKTQNLPELGFHAVLGDGSTRGLRFERLLAR